MNTPIQPLNKAQTEILLILYKFRFTTVDLTAAFLQSSATRYIQIRFKNLLNQGYVGRHYTGQDKLAGRPAVYYITTQGIRFLLSKPDLALNHKVLNLLYKDKDAGESFIYQSLQICKLYCVFVKLYGQDVDFYTKSEIAEYPYFMKPLPHGFLSFNGAHSGQPDCIIELVSATTPYFVVRRRMSQYYNHVSSYTWQNETGAAYPALILVVDNVNLERRLQKSIARGLDERNLTTLKIYTTTDASLLAAQSSEDTILREVTKPTVQVALRAL